LYKNKLASMKNKKFLLDATTSAEAWLSTTLNYSHKNSMNLIKALTKAGITSLLPFCYHY
jgi:hypothetical protein